MNLKRHPADSVASNRRATGWIVLVCSALLSVTAHAQFTPNFDTYTPSFSLSGQQGWVTNDTNQKNYIGTVNGYSVPASSYWAELGGLLHSAPSTANVDLYRTFTLPDNGNAAVFSVNFAISSSSTPFTTQDAFSWKFRTADGTPIVSVDFKQLDSTTLKLYWTAYNGTQTSTTYGIGYNSVYLLNATVAGLGTSTPQFRVDLTDSDGISSTAINTSLSASTPTGIGQVAASWNLTSGTPAVFGSNSLLFHNYSVIPEPATLAFLGLSGVSLIALRLRRKVG